MGYTSIAETLGVDEGQGDRGYVFDGAEHIRVDSAGYRPLAAIGDIVDQLLACHAARRSPAQAAMIDRGLQFTRQHTWESV